MGHMVVSEECGDDVNKLAATGLDIEMLTSSF